MINLTRVEPRQELARWDPFREMEGFFAPARLRSMFRDLPAEPEFRMDVTEDAEAYRVKAEIPGVRKEDIRIEIDGNQVAITAESRREKEDKKGEAVVCSERYYGRQYRSFALRHEVDAARSDAKYADGVLELTLPKCQPAAAKVVAVK
jgi:HSP20 family protein